MHQLIRDYRESKKIPINHELQEMKAFATNYNYLMLVQKIEVFEHVLETTRGDDLREVGRLVNQRQEFPLYKFLPHCGFRAFLLQDCSKWIAISVMLLSWCSQTGAGCSDVLLLSALLRCF